jgi:hypothetical protein
MRLSGNKWHARKHGGPKRRVWRKIHIGLDEQTLEIRAIEVTGRNIGGPPMRPYLLDQIAPDQEIGSVTADGACDTLTCHGASGGWNAHAFIPPRKDAKLWKPRFRAMDTPEAQTPKRSGAILKVFGARSGPP